MKLFAVVELEAWEDVYRFSLGPRNASGKVFTSLSVSAFSFATTSRFAETLSGVLPNIRGASTSKIRFGIGFGTM